MGICLSFIILYIKMNDCSQKFLCGMGRLSVTNSCFVPSPYLGLQLYLQVLNLLTVSLLELLHGELCLYTHNRARQTLQRT